MGYFKRNNKNKYILIDDNYYITLEDIIKI